MVPQSILSSECGLASSNFDRNGILNSNAIAAFILTNGVDRMIQNGSLFITMHANSTLAYDDSNSLIPISDNGIPVHAVLTFRRIEQQLMPEPYDTHCVSDSISSSAHTCYDKCSSFMYAQKFNQTPYETPLHVSSLEHLPRQRPVFGNDQRKEIIRTKCKKKCRSDCFETNYFMQVQSSYESINRSLFQISAPAKEMTQIVYSPQLGLIDLLSVVLNCASFWLSFCPAAFFLSDWFLKRCRKPDG